MTESAHLKYQDSGRGVQKEIMSQYYRDLELAHERKKKVAYLFISGNIVELLRPFGFEVAYPEVNALQCGIKHAAGDLILKAEDYGYSSDVCGYVKNDIGMLLNGMKSPLGTLPKADLLVCNFSGCNTYIKWWEALAQMTGAELFMLDVPYTRGAPTQSDLKYIISQLEELVRVCERVTGKKWDEAAFRESLALSRAAEERWVEIMQMAKLKPSPLDAFFEAVFFMAPINVLRGTRECAEYYNVVLREMEERVEHGISPAGEEKVRIVMEGPPPWPHFRSFWELFKPWGVTCVAATYPKVGGLWDATDDAFHDPQRPMESLAKYAINCYTNWNWEKRRELISRYIRDYQADAMVIHSVKSCRSFSIGQADLRDFLIHERSIPSLLIESDLADPRYFSKAQLKNRIDAFFESLLHRKMTHAPAAPAAVAADGGEDIDGDDGGRGQPTQRQASSSSGGGERE